MAPLAVVPKLPGTMHIYLPIADIPINALLMLALGGVVGFLSGMFGVGGGFLMTPLLIFAGVPSAVAVATGANPLIASSITGTIAQYRRKNVDIKLGLYLLAGGAAGALLGVHLVKLLRQAGQFDLAVSLIYVVFMSTVGGIMFIESLRAVHNHRNGKPAHAPPARQRGWIHPLPFRTRFKTSKLYISALPPIGLGLLVGLLSGVMGVGGGFVMVPILIYVLRVPTEPRHWHVAFSGDFRQRHYHGAASGVEPHRRYRACADADDRRRPWRPGGGGGGPAPARGAASPAAGHPGLGVGCACSSACSRPPIFSA